MHPVDLSIFVLYLLAMLGIGVYFLRHNQDADDYYVGGRSMGPLHIGLSVVATDVGGGFSIGLGGLGFAMGLSGSWMLFTGLLGAWMAAVWLIPRVFPLAHANKLHTYPQLFGILYDKRVAVAAAWVSVIGYTGFTASQLLAGAKLASATIPDLSLQGALVIMGVLAVVYTSIGGIKAVIFTDTIQWAILLVGLSCIGIPVAWHAVGGWSEIRAAVPPGHLSLTNIGPVQLLNWGITILPIWFVGMTLYQRIYACRDERTARRAWYVAGLFEWPIMAFLGVTLGMLGRVAFQQGLFAGLGYAAGGGLDSEMGLPLLLATTLPAGLMGLVMAAYFSAILSTADSCLMAASGNVSGDLLPEAATEKAHLSRSQVTTLAIGVFSLLLAWRMTNVLELMLYSYAFMVSGLLVPTIAAFGLRRPHATSALVAMLAGGGTTLVLILSGTALPAELDANVGGIAVSLAAYSLGHAMFGRPRAPR